MAFRREAEAGLARGVIPLVSGADLLRRRAWWLASRTQAGRSLLGQRDLRLVAMAGTHALALFAAALFAPLAMLLLGPLLFGVPHFVADVRYLLLDRARPLPRRALFAIAPPLVALTLLPLVPDSVVDPSAALWIAGTIAIAAGITTASRRMAPLLACALVALALLPLARIAILAFVQLHNAVALAVWLARWRAPARAKTAAAALLLLPAFLLVSGPCDALLAGSMAKSFAGLGFAQILDSVAPGAAPLFAMRAVALFAYGQAVHYVVWLRLLPQADAPGPAPLSFSRGLAGLRRALGTPLFLVAIAASIALPMYAILDPLRARDLYLLVVASHGWLELAVLAHFACRT